MILKSFLGTGPCGLASSPLETELAWTGGFHGGSGVRNAVAAHPAWLQCDPDPAQPGTKLQLDLTEVVQRWEDRGSGHVFRVPHNVTAEMLKHSQVRHW